METAMKSKSTSIKGFQVWGMRGWEAERVSKICEEWVKGWFRLGLGARGRLVSRIVTLGTCGQRTHHFSSRTRGLMDATCRVRLSVILTSVILEDLYSMSTKSISKPHGSKSRISLHKYTLIVHLNGYGLS